MKNIIYLIVVALLCAFGWLLYTHAPTTSMSVEEETPMVDIEPLPNDTIVGIWRSTDDPDFVRTIYENGGFLDAYNAEPSVTTEGAWVTFTSENAPEGLPFTIVDGVTYLQLDSGEEVLNFSIAHVSAEALILTYLDRGGSLSFVRE